MDKEKLNIQREMWNGKMAENFLKSEKLKNEELSRYQFDVLRRLDITSGSVLEAGPGNGRDMKTFDRMGFKTNAIDISEPFIRNLKHSLRGKFVVDDLRNVGNLFENMDLIYSRWSIFFFTYPEFIKFLSDCNGILKPGGHLFVSMRFGDKLSNIHAGHGTQSIQMNMKNLFNALPEEMEIVFSEVSAYASTESKDDIQFAFVLKKKVPDTRVGIYIE